MPAGVILFPKPAGVTSHDVVAQVRRRLAGGRAGGRSGRTKVGHAGTLDPFATGLLLVLVGQATRAQRFLMALPKTYRVVARLGWTSDTGDRDGRLVETRRMPECVEIATGELWQRPPAWSAVKVGGERLYKRARRGEPVEGEPRRVVVHRADTLWRDRQRAAIEIECSSGTYVRQLVASLGDAYCEELERSRIGPFELADASKERVIPLDEALGFLPGLELGHPEAERVSHGVAVAAYADGRRQVADGDHGSEAAVSASAGASQAVAAVRLTHEGRLLALAEPRGDRLQPILVLAA